MLTATQPVFDETRRPLWIATCENGIASMCALAEWGNDSASELECHAELQALVDEWCRAVGR